MTLQAKLTVRLLANDVVIAESDDDILWRKVLTSLQGTSGDEELNLKPLESDKPAGTDKLPRSGGGVAAFAKELETTAELVDGACTPQTNEPYIHFDERSWEAFRKNTPARGPGAVAPVQLAGTLLCLWLKHAGVESGATVAQAQAVLATIGERDKNAARSIKNCDWLQVRDGKLRINAARHSTAVSIARSYVNQTSRTEG